ncbi:MAG: hypothetical protein AAFQ53_16940, partial [Bacteroidota bacterium]
GEPVARGRPGYDESNIELPEGVSVRSPGRGRFLGDSSVLMLESTTGLQILEVVPNPTPGGLVAEAFDPGRPPARVVGQRVEVGEGGFVKTFAYRTGGEFAWVIVVGRSGETSFIRVSKDMNSSEWTLEQRRVEVGASIRGAVSLGGQRLQDSIDPGFLVVDARSCSALHPFRTDAPKRELKLGDSGSMDHFEFQSIARGDSSDEEVLSVFLGRLRVIAPRKGSASGRAAFAVDRLILLPSGGHSLQRGEAVEVELWNGRSPGLEPDGADRVIAYSRDRCVAYQFGQ